jgi:hypothetical protein
MRNLIIAFVFLVGLVLLVGGCLFYEVVAIALGAVLCLLAAVSTDRFELDLTSI